MNLSIKQIKLVYILLLLVTLSAFVFGSTVGSVHIPMATVGRAITQQMQESDAYLWQIWLHIRLPRVFAALLIGGMLAITGAVMQGLFRNPLVDPGIVGVMSGASFAAILNIVIGGTLFPTFYKQFGSYSLPISAFIGGWVVTLFLYAFSKRNGIVNVASMLLIGIAISALMGALSGILVYLADDVQLRTLTFWSMGSLAVFDWIKLTILSGVCLFSIPLLLRDSHALNAMMLGENIAGHLGFNVERIKRRQIMLVALMVGTCVAFAGIIGFVGLVVPHIVRSVLGTNYRYMLPATFLFGSCLVLLSDLASRVVVAPAELPIGIITALIGAPFLGFLVWSKLGKIAG